MNTPPPNFNDGKMGMFWFLRGFIIDSWGGGLISCLSKVVGRPVGWGGSRGSNEPPKIFEVGIFGGLKK